MNWETDATRALDAIARYREWRLSCTGSCVVSPAPELTASQLRQCDRLLGLGEYVLRDPVFRIWARSGALTQYIEDPTYVRRGSSW